MEVDDQPTLLIVEDDLTFCGVLAKAMTQTRIQRHLRAFRGASTGMRRDLLAGICH